MKFKEESEKVGLKLSVQKTKIMASSPITSWEIDGETVETVSDFIFLGSKITADGDCSHEIKRHLLLGRKVMINLDSILKSRDITLPTKFHLVSPRGHKESDTTERLKWSKKEIKNWSYYEFYCLYLHCAMFVSNANIKAFNWYIKSPKLHSSYFVAHTCVLLFQENENTAQN